LALGAGTRVGEEGGLGVFLGDGDEGAFAFGFQGVDEELDLVVVEPPLVEVLTEVGGVCPV